MSHSAPTTARPTALHRVRRYLFLAAAIPFGFLLFGGLSYVLLATGDPLETAGGFFFALLGMYAAALAPGALREWVYEVRGFSSSDADAKAEGRTNWGIPLAPTVLALFGILPWDAAFYTLLRIVVTTAAVVYIVSAVRDRSWFFVIALAAAALFFNPIVSVYLDDKAVWLLLDTVTVALLWAAAFRFRRVVDQNL